MAKLTMASSKPVVSVVIPTYNRKVSLLRTLDSLKQQNYPRDDYEIVIVDDGSTDGTETLDWSHIPVRIRYLRQKNARATKARNKGAQNSQGDILVFIDDDIAVMPDTLKELAREVSTRNRTIVLGTLIPAFEEPINPFAVFYGNGAIFPGDVDKTHPMNGQKTTQSVGCFIHFTKCKTGLLCLKKYDFQALGMFQDPTNGMGWPNWDDVDFGYRAHLQGYCLWRSYNATAYHYDYSLGSLNASCQRFFRISRSATLLFERHPELLQYTAYLDKTPISLRYDAPSLIIRKGLRGLVSSPASIRMLQWLASLLERYKSDIPVLILLYRWILSAYMFQGFRQGLREQRRSRQ